MSWFLKVINVHGSGFWYLPHIFTISFYESIHTSLPNYSELKILNLLHSKSCNHLFTRPLFMQWTFAQTFTFGCPNYDNKWLYWNFLWCSHDQSTWLTESQIWDEYLYFCVSYSHFPKVGKNLNFQFWILSSDCDDKNQDCENHIHHREFFFWYVNIEGFLYLFC